MNAFAGGVFLAMALCHILPESNDDYNTELKLLRATNGTPVDDPIFPLPYLLYFVGYSMILFIDRIISGHFTVDNPKMNQIAADGSIN